MLQERETWMERRAEFRVLHVGIASASGYGDYTFMVVSPGHPLSGHCFDLIVAPLSVQREHKRWLEDTLLTRLKPGGKLILVD